LYIPVWLIRDTPAQVFVRIRAVPEAMILLCLLSFLIFPLVPGRRMGVSKCSMHRPPAGAGSARTPAAASRPVYGSRKTDGRCGGGRIREPAWPVALADRIFAAAFGNPGANPRAGAASAGWRWWTFFAKRAELN